ncbi:MAG: ArdC-like ssDNA-binding domain-containing protein [Firmicutes bacterium]|jgi:antirestriction protein ArdC|nr:ArdC-like ssDNA-binding domain-containing protein [Bacillota bacterium]
MASINRSQDVLDQLSQGISTLATSDEWQAYLKMQARFHNYSYANVLLIMKQYPDATQVAGYGTWKSLGRHVKKGEKAIAIMAPILYKAPNEATETLETENKYRLCGFKIVNVFDVSQTEGKSLTDPCQKLNGGNCHSLYHRLCEFANSLGFHVFQKEMGPELNGNCSHTKKRININKSNSSTQQIKTLIHEIAHAVMHENFDDRALGELEAESVAYVTCESLGIDSSDYSFGYILSWAGNSANAELLIRQSCSRIQKTSSMIIAALSESKDAAA